MTKASYGQGSLMTNSPKSQHNQTKRMLLVTESIQPATRDTLVHDLLNAGDQRKYSHWLQSYTLSTQNKMKGKPPLFFIQGTHSKVHTSLLRTMNSQVFEPCSNRLIDLLPQMAILVLCSGGFYVLARSFLLFMVFCGSKSSRVISVLIYFPILISQEK